MKFRRTQQFRNDFDQLSESDKKSVKKAFPSITLVLALVLEGNRDLFRKYRLKRMVGFPEIWEGHVKINLCFTFHRDFDSNGEIIIFFRRIGTHNIYKIP